MNPILRRLFMIVLVYPVVFVWLGVSVWQRRRLPVKGPAILVANHNSHLDVLTLLSLFPLSFVDRVQPAAAADYFLKSRFLAWFSLRVVGVIPVTRGGDPKKDDPLKGCAQALNEGRVLILFPEGTRGEPEQLSEIKNGLWFLSRQFPDVPIIPIFMFGLGRSMGKGQWIPVPFFVDVYVDEPMYFDSDKERFRATLSARFQALQQKSSEKDTIDETE
jgi:1-acyl-sn-glycerol-3-phosphate acyltransferase